MAANIHSPRRYLVHPHDEFEKTIPRQQPISSPRAGSTFSQSIASPPSDATSTARTTNVVSSSSTTHASGLILCGICKKAFHPLTPEALLEHLAAHFDMRYDFHRCQRCEINFVSELDLRRHSSSAARSQICGFIFEHKQPCTGHHPPRQRAYLGADLEDSRRYSFMRHSDDARFDFCFRLRNWEQLQLQTFHQRRQPAMMAQEIPVKRKRWTGLMESCRPAFMHRSKSHTSLRSNTPLIEKTLAARDTEIFVPNSDILGTMLLRAVCTGNFELIASLIYAKANVHMEDSFGFGPMHYAARYASPHVTRFLARTGIYVDKADDSGMTPLSHAVKIGRAEIVECFLGMGAELRLEHLDLAVASGDSETAEILLEYWSKRKLPLDLLDTLLLTATKAHDAAIVELLLEHGARALARDEAGRTAMSIASEAGDREIVQLLFDYGAEPDHWGAMQNKMLHEAVEYRHIAMVQMLLSKGR